MVKIIIFLGNFLINFIRKDRRFIRINPNQKGPIFFFDKFKKNFFRVFSRDRIDSVTADEIFTKNSYNLNFLKRYSELQKIYNDIIKKKNSVNY